MQDALNEAGIIGDVDWNGHVDLALSSVSQLLIIEFMRPGLTVDRNHMDRFQRYVDTLRSRIGANTALGLRDITGLLVADTLHRRPKIKWLSNVWQRTECIARNGARYSVKLKSVERFSLRLSRNGRRTTIVCER